jgi:predicted small lipoprotein YifL
MNKVKKVFALLIVAVVLVGLAGCKKKSETPDIDHPTKETVTEEAPTEEDVPNEPPSAEHPTGEHPK